MVAAWVLARLDQRVAAGVGSCAFENVDMTTAQRMPPGPAPKSTGVKLTRAEMTARDDKIMRLFISGCSEYEISRAVGVTRQRCHQIIRAGIERSARHHRLLDDQALTVYVSRLEVLLKAVWPKAIAGDLRAIEQARRVLAAQARLFRLEERIDAVRPMVELVDEDDVVVGDELSVFRRRHPPRESLLDGDSGTDDDW